MHFENILNNQQLEKKGSPFVSRGESSNSNTCFKAKEGEEVASTSTYVIDDDDDDDSDDEFSKEGLLNAFNE